MRGHRHFPSFPTRRSSDLELFSNLGRARESQDLDDRRAEEMPGYLHRNAKDEIDHAVRDTRDRKSTRLNSSHANISYAAFCLRKRIEHAHNRCEKDQTTQQ